MARWRSAAPPEIPAWVREFDPDTWAADDDPEHPASCEYRRTCRWIAARNAWLAGHPAASKQFMAELVAELIEETRRGGSVA